MRRRTAKRAAVLALCCTIWQWVGIGIGGAFADPGQGKVCFTFDVSARLLGLVEKAAACQEELELCRAFIAETDNTLASHREEMVGLEQEIEKLRQERDRAAAESEEAVKAGTRAVEAAKGSWWDRALSTLKWVGLGAVLGFALGVATR